MIQQETWLDEAVLLKAFIVLENNRTGDEANDTNTAVSTDELYNRSGWTKENKLKNHRDEICKDDTTSDKEVTKNFTVCNC